METPKAPSDLESTTIESLPDKPVADVDADGIKGGVKRRGGDDDLDDLEVER